MRVIIIFLLVTVALDWSASALQMTPVKEKKDFRQEKGWLLKWHNVDRRLVSRGKIEGQPPSKNVRNLVSDTYLKLMSNCLAVGF